MKILVTGSAGFIGSYIVQYLLERGNKVTGLDNINDYYDVELKYGRLLNSGIHREDIKWGYYTPSKTFQNYKFIQMNLEDDAAINTLFLEEKFDMVCHMGAQAGVRYSIENPRVYTSSNIIGFLNILEGCRNNNIKHLVFASSSSVYGLNEKVPFSEKDSTAHPISLYSATKQSNELMAHAYSNLYNLPTTGLRFFTVYGPWGRPDMAPFLFTDAILNDVPINVFNNGDMLRDFTYIDDIVEGVIRVLDTIPKSNPLWDAQNPEPDSSSCPYRIYNIGNSNPIKLIYFISAIEDAVGKKAVKNFLPMQLGDLYQTNADTSSLLKDIGYKPTKNILDGIQETVTWYKDFYKH